MVVAFEWSCQLTAHAVAGQVVAAVAEERSVAVVRTLTTSASSVASEDTLPVTAEEVDGAGELLIFLLLSASDI